MSDICIEKEKKTEKCRLNKFHDAVNVVDTSDEMQNKNRYCIIKFICRVRVSENHDAQRLGLTSRITVRAIL